MYNKLKKEKNMNTLFMAFGKAKESKDFEGFKRYYGKASTKIVAINPTKEEIEAMQNRTLDKEPEYLTTQEINGKQVPTVRFDFYLKTVPEHNNGIETDLRLSFFVSQARMFSKDNTKVKVIDKYARTAWASVEEAKQHLIPTYSNGPARIDAGYRPLYRGEEQLIMFVKAFLGIEDVDEYANGAWRMKKNPEECAAGFTEIEKWFKGDISEVKDAIALMPNNEVKVLVGVRTTDEGKEYQDVFNRKFMPYNSRTNKWLQKELDNAKANGAYANTVFCEGTEIHDLKEYVVNPTDFTAAPAAANPFSSTPAAADDDLPFGDNENPWG